LENQNIFYTKRISPARSNISNKTIQMQEYTNPRSEIEAYKFTSLTSQFGTNNSKIIIIIIIIHNIFGQTLINQQRYINYANFSISLLNISAATFQFAVYINYSKSSNAHQNLRNLSTKISNIFWAVSNMLNFASYPSNDSLSGINNNDNSLASLIS